MSELDSKKENENRENWIQINGYEQVLEMLKAADQDFRNSLLHRISQRNRPLAQKLLQELQSRR